MASCSGCWFRRAARRGRRCFPGLRRSGSRLLSMERALRCARLQPPGVPQTHGLGCACVLCLPRPSGSGSQELDGSTLPGAARLLPSAAPAPVPARTGWSGACALCLAATLSADVDHPESQEVLVRNWRPACSAAGAAVLGAEPAPFPSPVPPASGGAGRVHSRLAPSDLLGPFVL